MLTLERGLCLAAALTSSTGWGMVLSEFYASGGKPGATFDRDYVVLRNTSAGVVDLSGWALQHWKVGQGWVVLPLPGAQLPPAGTFLIRLYYDQGTADGQPLPSPSFSAPDQSDWNLSTSNGEALALTRTTAQLSGCTSSALVDLVGYNVGAPCTEGGTVAPTTRLDQASTRLGGGSRDTDDNGADFVLAIPLAGWAPDGGAGALDGGGADAGPAPGGDGGASPFVDGGAPRDGGAAMAASDAGLTGDAGALPPRQLGVGCACAGPGRPPGSVLEVLGVLLAGARLSRRAPAPSPRGRDCAPQG